ncbi:papain family cysteine protease [Oesophagostomum dentatum]|uniref:Papain family cysteine protease n=1 Tax=Oesophagostomum dentatum TaxID=61180 RepID=A0A0B1TTC4_OESDE|nr:papain family cysteine protease [Oesophagostomum dentatum]
MVTLLLLLLSISVTAFKQIPVGYFSSMLGPLWPGLSYFGMRQTETCMASVLRLEIISHKSRQNEFVARPIPEFAKKLTGQDLVDYVNLVQPFFVANLSTLTEEQRKALIMDERFLEENPENGYSVGEEVEYNGQIPESYDAREHYPQCASLQLIRDQSACGSCWAVSAASAMSDRLCIQSKGKKTALVSDADILSCCKYWLFSCGRGCQGGYPIRAWQYVRKYGTCSGGPFDPNEKGVCKPYPFYPCRRHEGKPYYGPCPAKGFDTPECKKECQTGFNKKYDEDKIKAKNEYQVKNNEEAIQKEILVNGPVQAGFLVYEDLYNYKKGVYVHTAGRRLGGHAVKIIGWGVEKGVKYWLIANSWNLDWGENGYLRMLRGSNHCSIESMVVAGMMEV